jgi:hypothetical protein
MCRGGTEKGKKAKKDQKKKIILHFGRERGLELKASHLQDRYSYYLSHAPTQKRSFFNEP